MGKTDFGFMAGFSGRLGNLIGYRWRGRMCVRTMPSHYRDARTPEQLQQRALFKAVVRFAAKARQVLKKGMNAVSLDAQMTESNYFMRVNKRCFALAAGTQDELQVDYENLLLADGPVAPVAFYEPQMLDETTLSVDFEKNPLHRAVKWEDLVYLVAYCPELGDFDISAPVYRRSNRLTMSLNPYWVGREVHLWGFVVDSNGRASQSQYLGATNYTDNPSATHSEPAFADRLSMVSSYAGGMPTAIADGPTAALLQDTAPKGVARIFQKHRIRC